MAATIQPSEIKMIVEDVAKGQAEYYLLVPIAQADNAAALAHAHTDVVRPLVSLARLVRGVVAVRQVFADGSETSIANGMLISHKVRFDLEPGASNRPVRISIPAFKRAYLSENSFTGKISRVRLQGDVATLADSWLTGIGGVRPVNSKGQPFTDVADGLLVTDGDA